MAALARRVSLTRSPKVRMLSMPDCTAMPPIVSDSTSLRTRSGCSRATCTPVQPPMDWQTKSADAIPRWSSNATASVPNRVPSNSSSVHVERPNPRQS